MSKPFNRRPPKNGTERDWRRWYKQEKHEKPKHPKNRAIDFDRISNNFDTDLSKFEGVWRQKNSWGLE